MKLQDIQRRLGCDLRTARDVQQLLSEHAAAHHAAHNIACAQACIEPDKTTSLDDSAPHHQAEAHAKLGALACAFLAALGECITHDNATCLSRETAKQREIAALRRLQAINEIARAAIALTTKG